MNAHQQSLATGAGAVCREITYSPHRLESTAVYGDDVVVIEAVPPTFERTKISETLQQEVVADNFPL